MKTAIITDSSAFLRDDVREKDNVFVLDIPIFIAGETYIEGKTLTDSAFYEKMAASAELPKTSQPSMHDLTELLDKLAAEGYTDRKSTRLNSSHHSISYAVFCLKKKKK